MSVISERLRDALEKGDVAELEVAITAAQSALEDNIYRSGPRGVTTGKLASLLSKAKDVFLQNLEVCKPYLKPLRKACRQLDERAIFNALVHSQSAPEHVQLYMYTDIRRAEELRESIVAAHEEAIRLLDADDWLRIDEFLNERASVLEDRTVLALVQKREDLLKGGGFRRSRPSAAAVVTDGYGGGRGGRDRADVARDASAISSSSNFLARHESDADAAADLRASPVEEPYHTAPTPIRRGAAGAANSFGMASQPAWKVITAASASRNSHQTATVSLRPFVEEEAHTRLDLVSAESRGRVALYKDVMRGYARAWAATHLGPTDEATEDGEGSPTTFSLRGILQGTGDAPSPRPQLEDGAALPAPSAYPAQPQTASLSIERETEDERDNPPEPRAAPPPKASFSPLEREGTQRTPTSRIPPSVGFADPHNTKPSNRLAGTNATTSTPTRHRNNRVGSAAEEKPPVAVGEGATALPTRHGQPIASARRASPMGRLAHQTPNLSPIKEATLLSLRDEGDVSGGAGGRPSLLAKLPAPSRMDGRGSLPNGSILRPPPQVNETAMSPGPNTPRDPMSTSGRASSSLATPRSYEARRLEVLLRATLEEEDLHRRDIEGTEDFDRCVFLYPMSARIDMLKRAQKDRQRMIAR